jgi:hypothetical protein
MKYFKDEFRQLVGVNLAAYCPARSRFFHAADATRYTKTRDIRCAEAPE